MSSSPETPESSKGGGAAMDRAVAGAVELPLLTRTNYHEWSLVMQVSLEALGLWGAVESVKVERRDDRMALAAILRGVPSELKPVLAVKKTAKEAWEAVKLMRVGEDRVKSANRQRLRKEFENVEFKDGESIDDFAVRINGLIGGLRELGEEVKDGRVVRKILRLVPKRWRQVAVAIEMLLDLDAMTVEELVGRLRVAEQADGEEAAAAADNRRLLLTEAQWEARRRQRGKESARGEDGRPGNSNRSSGGGGDGDDRSERDDDASSTCSGRSRRGGSRNRGRCFECGERGHLARHCRERKKEKVALLASTEEEATLP